MYDERDSTWRVAAGRFERQSRRPRRSSEFLPANRRMILLATMPNGTLHTGTLFACGFRWRAGFLPDSTFIAGIVYGFMQVRHHGCEAANHSMLLNPQVMPGARPDAELREDETMAEFENGMHAPHRLTPRNLRS